MVNVDRNDIKKIRTIKIFIDAAAQIIEEKGIEAVTIREVAKIAGYNSATIYNYFDNRNQLVFFAAVQFIGDYVRALPDYMNQSEDTLERFILNWECFCKYSFKKPQIYYALFTADIGDCPEDLIQNYYKLFPEEIGSAPQELIPMLVESDLSKRASLAIQPCIEEGYFTREEAAEVDEMIMLVYQGMFSLITNNRLNYPIEEAIDRIVKYIRRIVTDASRK